jgi:hypothetical protein
MSQQRIPLQKRTYRLARLMQRLGADLSAGHPLGFGREIVMRYLVGFVFVLALVASPLSVSAQVDDNGKGAESADTPQPARGVQRWHPEAFVDPLTGATLADAGKSDFEIEYVAVERPPRNRKRAIALGVTIPILIVGVGVGIGAAVAMRNFMEPWSLSP